MALIKCPECGKEISDKAPTCIHCGYPLEEEAKKSINKKCIINGKTYDFTEEYEIAILPKTDDYVSAIGKIRKKTSLSLTDGKKLVEMMRENKCVPETFTPSQAIENREQLYGNSKPIVKCPYCQSTNTKKVSDLSKAGSVALWGLFSQKVKKQWHCNNCGSEW